jgi:hypothetical protein
MADTSIRNARELLAARGRRGDTELAHISRGERNLLRAWQGYENINPDTGLPEYFSFKKILKGVAKAAGAAAGAYFGGPAGAAVGGALATKLTGGSWKSALGTGLLSGISAYGVQQSGAGDYLGISSLGKGADLLGRTASGVASAAGSGGGGGFDFKSLLPVAAVGIGALSGGAKQPKVSTGSAKPAAGYEAVPSWQETTKPLDRDYRRYGEDYYTYGQDAGEHEFYDEVNPAGYAHGGIAHFKYGGDTREGGVTGKDRGRANMGGRGGSDKSTADKIKAAYADPSRQFDTPENARKVADIMAKGDPTTFGGLQNRIPGPTAGIQGIMSGNPTPENIAQTFGQGIGLIGGNPMGTAVSAGIGMGSAVNDVRTLRDMGLLGGKTTQDPSMGRVDTVDGRAYSLGNPGADDRAPNTGGIGAGMTGGNQGDGQQVLATLTQAFTPPPTAAAGGPDIPAAPVNTGSQVGRTMQSPEDYYTYGQRPEWEFFDEVNPVAAKKGGAQKKLTRAKPEWNAAQAMPSQAQGGTIKGAGSGQSDEIPAMLSSNEHVVDAATVAALGDGSSDEGHRRLEKMKALIRKQAGYKNTKSIPQKQRGIGSLLKEVA